MSKTHDDNVTRCKQEEHSLCEHILSTDWQHNGTAIDVNLLKFSDQICCQSIDILLIFCLLDN